MKIVFLFCLYLSGFLGFSQEWELKRSANNIQVYTRELDSTNINEYKAVLRANTSAEKALKILTNGDNLKSWNHKTPESEILQKISENEYIFYMKSDLPWPLSDRDHICRVTVNELGFNTYKLNISPADPSFTTAEKNAIRIDNFSGFWLINTIDDNTVEITQQMYGDPKGVIPAWLVNSLITSFPFHSFENLKEILEN
ncbi:lipid-binding protein [Galbibacter sp. BG1]|uniref:START domain-containing protein n=1 Tax=Galbibacter sp. BG1 TaxID=1170699 RepID=UPI0015BE7C93|nr:START domain-containing protein [Galbibacter sp. BG1]QLE00905.1 lipid-binding protein [Galbibacter sp. BG1]